MATFQDVIDALNRYETKFNDRAEEIPYEIANAVRVATIRGGHIDTTAFIQSLDYYRDVMVHNDHRFHIDASAGRVRDVFYDGWLEFPRKGWPGAFVYEKGIRSANIQGIFDSIAAESFI